MRNSRIRLSKFRLRLPPNRRIFSNRLLWLGFSIAMGINLLNGAASSSTLFSRKFLFRKYDLNVYFTQKPLDRNGQHATQVFIPT